MSKLCSTGCGRPVVARSLCNICYLRAKRAGTLPDAVRRPSRELAVQAGQRFGRGIVLSEFSQSRQGKPVRWAQLQCDCGTIYETRLTDLFNRDQPTRSCGCLHREVTGEIIRENSTRHGLHGHLLYNTWAGMMTRCYNPRHKQFKDYGGRGITVCERWHDVRLFIADIERIIGPRPPGMTLDRPDNNSGYGPGEVRWATRSEQRRNSRHDYGHNNSSDARAVVIKG